MPPSGEESKSSQPLEPNHAASSSSSSSQAGKLDSTQSSGSHLPLTDPPYSRWNLSARAAILRRLANIGYAIHHRYSPLVPNPTRTTYIDPILSPRKGAYEKIRLDIYEPSSNSSSSSKSGTGRVGVIVFHGGGMVIGNGTDDARWAMACTDQLDAIVIAVSYRLAPTYSFPTPVEDAADAIHHISTNAKTFGIDPDRLFLSGFSSGGNLVFSALNLLSTPAIWGYPDRPIPSIKGIVAFYPILDWSMPRNRKRDACPRPELTLAKTLTDLFDMSYLYPPPDGRDVRLSPGIAPDEDLKRLPPVHLCLCENDMLLAEGLRFKERLERLGKNVSCRIVQDEKHGWDKPPGPPKGSVGIEYGAAITMMGECLTGKRVDKDPERSEGRILDGA